RSHRSAHEGVLHRANDDADAVEFPLGAENGITFSDTGLVHLQAVAVALRVTKLEWVARSDVAGEFFVLAVVEQDLETLAGAEPEVVIALRTDVEVLLHFLAVDDLFAVVALDPEPLRDRDFLDRFLRLFLFTKPRHFRDCSSSRRLNATLRRRRSAALSAASATRAARRRGSTRSD